MKNCNRENNIILPFWTDDVSLGDLTDGEIGESVPDTISLALAFFGIILLASEVDGRLDKPIGWLKMK